MNVYTLNGTRLDPRKQFHVGNQGYPAGWLLSATSEEIARTGVVVTTEPDPEPAPTPPRRRFMASYFRSLFTDAEMLAITTASSTDARIRVFLDEIASAEEVNLDGPKIAAACNYLISKSLLTTARRDQVLAGQVPV